MTTLNLDNFEAFIKERIESELKQFFDNQLKDGFHYHNSLLANIYKLVEGKFLDQFMEKNYTDIAAQIDTTKLIKLIEAKLAMRLISPEAQ